MSANGDVGGGTQISAIALKDLPLKS